MPARLKKLLFGKVSKKLWVFRSWLMKRWEVLLWLLLAGLLAAALSWWWLGRSADEMALGVTVNPYARLAASGSPLPSDAQEDVIIEQQQLDGRIFELHYDAADGSWQFAFFAEGRRHTLRYLALEETFFYFDSAELLWYEVDPNYLSEEIRSLVDIEQYLLTDRQLNGFNSLAVESESVLCKQTAQVLCAVWQASDPQTQGEVVIYVNKQSRKIDHVVSVNSSDLSQGSVIANYKYQPLQIQRPPEEKIRYLEDD